MQSDVGGSQLHATLKITLLKAWTYLRSWRSGITPCTKVYIHMDQHSHARLTCILALPCTFQLLVCCVSLSGQGCMSRLHLSSTGQQCSAFTQQWSCFAASRWSEMLHCMIASVQVHPKHLLECEMSYGVHVIWWRHHAGISCALPYKMTLTSWVNIRIKVPPMPGWPCRPSLFYPLDTTMMFEKPYTVSWDNTWCCHRD